MSRPTILSELPATLKLALPIGLGMLGHMLIQLTDTMMLGHYSTLDLASSAFGSSLVIMILYLGIGFGQSVSALSSRALGSGDSSKAYGVYRLAAWSAFVFSILAVCVALLILPLYDHLGQPELVAANAKPYSILLAFSFIPTLIFQTLRNYYEALRRAWVPFLFLIITVVSNIFFNYVLIFGKFGFPPMGIIGSGIGTVLARTFTAVLFMIFAHAKTEVIGRAPKAALAWDQFGGIMKITLGAGLGMTTMMLAYLLGGLWIGTMGTNPLAANRIVGMIDGTLYMLWLGIAIALTNRIGHALGEGNFGRIRAIYRGGLLAMSVVGFSLVLFICFGNQTIISAFTSNPETALVARTLLTVAAGFLFFDQLNGVVMGALKGLADVAKPAMIYFVIYWLFAMPLGYYLAFGLGMGAVGVWLGYSAGIIPTALSLLVRFNLKLEELKKPQTVEA